MALQPRAHNVLGEDPGPACSTQARQFTAACNSSFNRFHVIFHIHNQIHTHSNIDLKKETRGKKNVPLRKS